MPRGTQVPVGSRTVFAYGAFTLSGRPFQDRSSNRAIGNFTMTGPTTPGQRTGLVWASPRSLAATRRIISFPRGTEMFQFPRFPHPSLCVQLGVTRHNADRVAPFGDLRLSLLDS